MNIMIDVVNPALWIVGSMTGWYASIGLMIWAVGWGVRFRFYENEAGLNLWLFSALLTLLILTNIIGNFGSATREWWEMPVNNLWWWVSMRYLVSLALAIVITRMDILLIRRWRAGTNFTVDVPPRESKTK